MKQSLAVILALLLFILLVILFHQPCLRLTGTKQKLPSTPNSVHFLPIILQQSSLPLTHRTDGLASWSSPIAVSPMNHTVWVVNPDSASVTVIDTNLMTLTVEIPTGEEPWALAVAPDGNYVYVADRATGEVSVIDTLSQTVAMTMSVGWELGGIALSPSGELGYVTSMATDEVVVLNMPAWQEVERIPVDHMPYALAVTDDGDGEDGDEQLYVTHLFAQQRPDGAEATDDGRQGVVTVIDLATAGVVTQTILSPDETGFPNLLTSIAVDGDQAWVPHTRAAPALPNGLTTRVFAAVSVLNTATQSEDMAAYLPLNDQDVFGSPVNNPVAAIPGPDAKQLYVVLAGSDLIEVINIAEPRQPVLEKFIAVGKNPRGMTIEPSGKRGYVMNYLSRSVSVIDLETSTVITEVVTTSEPLAPDVLQGKILFNNAVNPKLSQGSWISCASCHPDGGTDSVTWIFPDGPRQTPPIWNAAATLPWHWSAALDEAQDVEETIHLIQLGLGLAPGPDPAQLGAPNANRSAELDALAAFMQHGIRIPKLPPPAAVDEGRQLFEAAGCVSCHGGPSWTTSALPGLPGTLDADGNGMVDSVLRNVGTLDPEDIRGATGFDVPSLLNLRLTAPYLHNGSAPTLTALLQSGHPTPTNSSPLSNDEIAALVTFLRSIDPTTVPFSTATMPQ